MVTALPPLAASGSQATLIQQVEEASLNAWPALHQVLHQGWLLRLAGGFTKRANAVSTLYDETATEAELRERLAFCESFYTSQGQPCLFKLTDQPQQQILDGLLALRGYQPLDPTWVMVLDLTQTQLPALSNPNALHSLALPQWLDVYARLNEIPAPELARSQALHLALLKQILLPRHTLCWQPENIPLACGLAVQQRQLLGLFDLITAPGHRRQGHGRALLLGLLAWGQAQGAHLAYLQVLADNEAALGLYQQLGFKRLYQYWYRAAPSS